MKTIAKRPFHNTIKEREGKGAGNIFPCKINQSSKATTTIIITELQNYSGFRRLQSDG